LERNRQRDADTDARLQEAAWLPIRIWEHEDPAEAANLTESLLSIPAKAATCSG